MRRRLDAPPQTNERPESNAPSNARGQLLELLYAIYKLRGAHASTDSTDIAHLVSLDLELVEGAAVDLHKKNLVTFDACDHGLINLRLTIEGIEQVENPGSDADWHAQPLP